MFKKTSFLIATLMAMIVLGCSTKKALENTTANDEDFKIFIERFNNDSLFLKTRVRYPFKNKVDLRITAIDTSKFRIKTTLEDSVTVNIALRENEAFYVNLIFKKDQGKWYLVNYQDSYED